MEDPNQNMKRFKVPAMAIGTGITAAVVIATLPHVYLESAIGATGLSELLPAAAPPLGNTARGLIAVMAGLVSASAIYFFLNRKGSSDMGVALREQINAASPIELDLEEEANAKKSRFSLPKFDAKSLTKFLKKPKKDKARVMDLSDLPQLRKADEAVAEQPARAPIFAEPETSSPELVEEIPAFEPAAPVEEAAVEAPVVEQMETLTTVNAVAAPAADENVAAVQETIAISSPVAPAAAQAAVSEMPEEDLSQLNIAQLADRLEAGLRRLKQLETGAATAAEIPVQQPVAAPAPAAPEPVSAPISEAPVLATPPLREVEKAPQDIAAVRQADMDAALKAALGTLEKMTAQR
ncbi:MAG: hypothetical protein ABJO01_10350 [Parasphingorhabdus sp.]|uniref:hypothetical protein n=1 Tax=Parasphingorhabdus sp. TaxID=2709688 RepID=UPI003299DE1F